MQAHNKYCNCLPNNVIYSVIHSCCLFSNVFVAVTVLAVSLWLHTCCFLCRMRQQIHTCQPSLPQAPFLPPEEGGTKGWPGEGPVCGQQGCGRLAGKVSEHRGLHILLLSTGDPSLLHTLLCPCRYWRTREQRAPTTTKVKPQGKARAEDQEQQDPMEFLQSDDEEDIAEEEKGSQGGAAKRRLQEQRERLHGALALIELANNLSAWTPIPSWSWTPIP